MECAGLKCSKSGEYFECARVEHWVHDFDLLIDVLINGDELMMLTVEGPLMRSGTCRSIRLEVHVEPGLMLKAIVRIDTYRDEPIMLEYPVKPAPDEWRKEDPCKLVEKLTGKARVDAVAKTIAYILDAINVDPRLPCN